MPDVVLEVRGLSKRYGSSLVVDRISFELYKGETLTLLGPSGCGKSTTLRLIAGLERPDAGDIRIKGSVVASAEERVFLPPEKRNVGMVFQSYAIWPHMTVEETVAYPLRVRRTKADEVRPRVRRILALIGLGEFAKRPATQLSGGQQQRVALARALVYEPDILLLDEPLSNLDAKLRHEMRVQLKRLQAALGTTMLFVTHDQLEAMTLSHRIAVMNAGRVEQLGAPPEIYRHPSTHFVHSFIGRSITLPGSLVSDGQSAYVEMGGDGRLAPVHGQWPPGTHPVWLSVRPEDIRILPDASQPEFNQLHGIVRDVSYAGDRSECAILVGESELLFDISLSLELRTGQAVTLAVDPAAATVWPS